MSNIWELEQRELENKILEERCSYFLHFGTDPDYVVIPFHYKRLLSSSGQFTVGIYDTYYGMQVIESKNCESIGDVRVY